MQRSQTGVCSEKGAAAPGHPGAVVGAWWHSRIPEPTVLAFRPGQAFEGVVKDSTFPVLAKSNIPDGDTGWGATWVTEPAVIIRLNDAEHGFILPPTKFAALLFQRNVVSTFATSPMLDELPFDEAVVIRLPSAAASSSYSPVPSHPPPDAPRGQGARNTS